MIAYLNPLQGEEFLDLCCVEPIIGARICSWYCCYANAYPFCDLWILYSDKKNPDFPAAGNHLGYPHGVAARYQGTLCIACDLEVDFEELAEFVAGSGAMEVECLTPIMDELLPRIPYRLRQRQTVMTYDFDREGQPGFPPAAVLSDRNFIYSRPPGLRCRCLCGEPGAAGDVRGDLPVLRGLPGEQPLPGLVCGHLCPHQKGGELPLRPLPGGGAGLHRRGV